MKYLADKLEFISQIKRDGSGTKKVSKSYVKHMVEFKERFHLICLSISEKTYIAHGFNSFVVRKKETK